MSSTPPAPALVDLGALVLVDLFTSQGLALALEVHLPPGADAVIAYVLLEGRPLRRVRSGSA